MLVINMANGLNKVMLIGNVGQSPEVRRTPSGDAVMNIRLATNERWKDKDGEWKDKAEWHSVVVWGARAEGLAKVLSKGDRIYVEGNLRTKDFEKDGQKHYRTEVSARDVILLGGGKREAGGDDYPSSWDE